MGLFERYREHISGEARWRKSLETDDKQTQALARQQALAEERATGTALLAEFAPLFDAIDARKAIADLIKIWKMGRVDEMPKLPRDYSATRAASLSWRKGFYQHWSLGDDGGNRIDFLTFAIEVRSNPEISFRFCQNVEKSMYVYYESSVELGRDIDKWKYGRSDWQKFDLNNPKSARDLLLDSMLPVIVQLPHPSRIIYNSKPICETPVRNPLLLSLGFPDFDLRARR